MSQTNIPAKIKTQLWTITAGRCQYENCNEPLWRDDMRMADMNRAYIAHIVADSPDGPRGDEIRSPILAKDIKNLMLMCDTHHRLIDIENEKEYPEERLLKMKRENEERVEMVTGIIPDSKTHILIYGANIGLQNTPLSYRETATAVLPTKYPRQSYPLEISLHNSSFYDDEHNYWILEAENLTRQVNQKILPQIIQDSINHLSIFALAPQPLLIKLGSLLTDLNTIDVFQRHREPVTWRWQEDSTFDNFEIIEPNNCRGLPVLNISLSGTITEDRIRPLFAEPISIWTITHSEPNNDFLKSRKILSEFRKICRVFFDKVKARHGQDNLLHVFPAMPISAAIEFGRTRMPKADLGLIIYDQNNKKGGFISTIEI